MIIIIIPMKAFIIFIIPKIIIKVIFITKIIIINFNSMIFNWHLLILFMEKNN